MKLMVLILVIVTAFAFVTSASAQQTSCSPWKGHCLVYEDCCRHLVCSTYQAKCIPEEGIIIPGQDTRPIGDGPFPPGYPRSNKYVNPD